jgi:hypothetical protein
MCNFEIEVEVEVKVKITSLSPIIYKHVKSNNNIDLDDDEPGTCIDDQH